MVLPLDHLLVLVLAVLFPIRAATFGYRRLKQAAEADVPRARLALYRQIIRVQWLLVALVAALWMWQGRSWLALGFSLRQSPGMLVSSTFVVCFIAAAFLQWYKLRNSEKAWAGVRNRVSEFERIMPRSPEDLRWFAGVSLTAGICEEFLYRAYLLWYLGHWMGIWPAIVVASIVFGVGHFYQGPRGMVRTGVVGAVMAGLYRISGSIFPGMLAHVFIDIYSGRMVYEAYQRAPAAPPAIDPGAAAVDPAPPGAPAATEV